MTQSPLRPAPLTDDGRRLIRDSAEMVVTRLLGEPTRRSPKELRFGRRGSLSVVTGGPKRGLWFDHEAGDGGDTISLVERELGIGFPRALEWCADTVRDLTPTAGSRRAGPTRQRLCDAEDAELRRREDGAVRIYESSHAIAGTPGEIYLRETRGLLLPPDLPEGLLRFAPDLSWKDKDGKRQRSPAFVVLLRDILTDRPCGVRCMPLTAEGQKARENALTFGRAKAAAAKLTSDADVTDGLGIAEGVETALRIMGTGFRPVWALGSSGNIRSFPPIPGIEALTIFVDHDRRNANGRSAGIDAAAACRARWQGAGREVVVTTPTQPGYDWDDALRAHDWCRHAG